MKFLTPLILAVIVLAQGIVSLQKPHLVDLWQESIHCHTFGYWKGGEWSRSILGKEPDTTVKIRINPYTGSYRDIKTVQQLQQAIANSLNSQRR